MVQLKTPGVYINEVNAFPNSVVEVATAAPVFVGYTETATAGSTDLTGKPFRLSSIGEYITFFGAGPTPRFTRTVDDNGAHVTTQDPTTQFNLFDGVRLYFNNGGGPCWIMSVGDYDTAPKSATHFDDTVWTALEAEPEPTMVVIPDAVLMPDPAAYKAVCNAALAHCIKMQNRVAILDIYNGFRARNDPAGDPIADPKIGFRSLIQADQMSFGVAYYPWLHTSMHQANEVTYLTLTDAARQALSQDVTAEIAATYPDEASEIRKTLDAQVQAMTGDDTSADTVQTAHTALNSFSHTYKAAMGDILKAWNLMPPAAAIAGVYARTDSQIGVWKAPANTGIASVFSPAVEISNSDQEDLNMPLDGKAINAIRSFPGRGLLVWGARTLDGNSQDWRYINVRRTLIMLEQSIKLAISAFVFDPNDARTWTSVRAMIDNFLTNQWKAGALVGATPDQAFRVEIGLGTTMTPQDILDGYMNVAVQVAVTRPAEFIVLTFRQEMQSS